MDPAPTSFFDLKAIRLTKRILVALVGGTVLALGIALLVLPGPAFIVIPAGLAILAVEFAWARRWLRKARGLVPRRRGTADPDAAATPAPSARGKWGHWSGLAVGGAVFVVASALLVLAGAAYVAIPAVLGIMRIESNRGRRGVHNVRRFFLRTRPRPTESAR